MPFVSYWLVLSVVFNLLKILNKDEPVSSGKGTKFCSALFPGRFFLFIFLHYKYLGALHR